MTTLVADIGGTNTRVALCDTPDSPREVARYRNAEFASLDAVLARYLADHGQPGCSTACVAVAGPVRGGAAKMTNLDWRIDAASVCAATGASAGFVINDLEAQGHALEDVLTRCLMGEPAANPGAETRLVVGLGTGFNAAPVHPVDGGTNYAVVPSESGHIGLPVWDGASLALSRELAGAHGYASVEEALSGRGILAVNAHVCRLVGVTPHATSQEFIAALSGTPGPTDSATSQLFCRVLGQVLSDFALIHLPFGGLYLIGGLARAMAPFFDAAGLPEAFHHKGRFSDFLRSFSLHIVEDDYSALTGCARYAKRHL
jgi:glucokinase